MPVPDFTKIVRKGRPTWTVTVKHDSFGEWSFDVSSLSLAMEERVVEKAREASRKYVEGVWFDEQGTRRTEPISLIANGQKCECSYETIHDAMRIEAMQVATLVSERVTWQQILSFANDCPHENDIYLQIYNQCNPLPSRPKEGEDEPRDDELGNDLLAASDSPLT